MWNRNLTGARGAGAQRSFKRPILSRRRQVTNHGPDDDRIALLGTLRGEA